MYKIHSKNISIIIIIIIFQVLFPFFATRPVSAETPDASFSLSPSTGTFYQGYEATLSIEIDTGSNVSDAADIIINYNQDEIDIIDADPITAGIQITEGNCYETFVGNTTDTANGTIRLTGFSINNYLNGFGTFGIIKFQSKESIESTTLSIEFTGIGDTLDSNIAEEQSNNDVLANVTNASFTFIPEEIPEIPPSETPIVPVPGIIDNTPPTITPIKPINYETDYPLDGTIVITFCDDISGVDIESIIISINGEKYTSQDAENFVYEHSSTYCYTVTLIPKNPFIENTAVFVYIEASDQDGNEASKSFLFNTPLDANSCSDYVEELEECKDNLQDCLKASEPKLPVTGSKYRLSDKLGIPGMISIIALIVIIIHPYLRNPIEKDIFQKVIFRRSPVELIIFITGFIIAFIGIIDCIDIISILTLSLYIFSLLYKTIRDNKEL